MPAASYGTQAWRDKRAGELVATVRRIVAGAPFLPSIAALERSLGQLDLTTTDDADARLLWGISSEVDHLPLGSERQHWDDTALAAKDLEITWYEAQFRLEGVALCERLIARFAHEATESP
jgi:hypothetical protein